MALFDTLGFQWNRECIPREIPRASVERAVFRFHRMFPEYVWDAGVLEGNPFTFPEVKTLLEGVTVGGRKLSDQEQILNLAESSKHLLNLVKNQEFKLEKSTFCALHALVARNEALEWGHFRGEGIETRFTPDVALGEHGRFTPLATEPGAVRLNEVFAEGIRSLEVNAPNTFERAIAFFLFGSLQQFFFDGNKRTSRFMMNGVLMSEGVDAVSIPAVRATEFNARMVDFYRSRDASEMMAFVLDCHPEVSRIRELNPDLCAVRDVPSIKYFSLSDSREHTTDDARSTAENPGAVPLDEEQTRAFSLAEARRRGREDWRRNYHEKSARRPKAQADSSRAKEHSDREETQSNRDTDLDFDSERD